MSHITDNIEMVLNKKHIGKYEFYSAVGVSATAYGKWKRGECNPRIENLQIIADYLGVTVSDLTRLPSENPPLKEEKTATSKDDGLSDLQIELLTLASQLDPDSLRFLTAKARELAEFRRFLDGQ